MPLFYVLCACTDVIKLFLQCVNKPSAYEYTHCSVYRLAVNGSAHTSTYVMTVCMCSTVSCSLCISNSPLISCDQSLEYYCVWKQWVYLIKLYYKHTLAQMSTHNCCEQICVPVGVSSSALLRSISASSNLCKCILAVPLLNNAFGLLGSAHNTQQQRHL